tara:strand:+ start:378 stop:530 length:153 start_codon:yes stop_codon:yes gene_type:complete
MSKIAWTPSQSFSMGRIKIGGDAKPVEEPPKEDGKKDDDKSKSNGKDNES